MSLKTGDCVANDRIDRGETPTINTVSDNVCYSASPILIKNRTKVAVLESLTDSERVELASRFWAKVRRSSGCWLWQGSKTRAYGQFTFSIPGRQYHIGAHRIAYWLTHGSGLAGLDILHKCDNPPCCRPDHLMVGTRADNLQDARNKGRLIDGLQFRKLTDDAYRDILAKPWGYGSGRALARKYGVSQVSISRIRNGHQGSTFHLLNPVEQTFERVPHRLVPVTGVLHVGNGTEPQRLVTMQNDCR